MDFVNWVLICVTCGFIVSDFVTGFIKACVNNCVDSKILKQGLFHKCGFLLAIVFGCLCEFSMQVIDLGYTIPFQGAICSYIILTEITSVLENLGEISPELKQSAFMQIFKK